jgi:hypothetical protein
LLAKAKLEYARFLARSYKLSYSGSPTNRFYLGTNLFNRPGVLSDMYPRSVYERPFLPDPIDVLTFLIRGMPS